MSTDDAELEASCAQLQRDLVEILREVLGMDDTLIHEVVDNGPAADGALVVNVKLVDGRTVHFVLEEGAPIAMRILDR